MIRILIGIIVLAALLIFGLSFVLLSLSGGKMIVGAVGLTMLAGAGFWIKEDFARWIGRGEPTQ